MSSRLNLEGTTIDGRYRLERELGRGSMGSVYEATQLSVDRRVAIKILHRAIQEQPVFEQRFEVEAKAIARLDHPQCITLHDFGFCDETGVYFMVTEFVEGQSLVEYLDRELPVSTIGDIAFQIADALVHAHSHGVLHRDLKPENIMLRKQGSGRLVVKILDFGLARLHEQSLVPHDEDARLTKVGHIYGTPMYMSPEQALGSRNVNEASDLYALGIILYELFEGRPPFMSQDITEVLRMQISKEVPPLTTDRVPPDLEELIFQLLEKDPDDRPMGAEDALSVLLKYAQHDLTQDVSLSSLEETDAEEIVELDEQDVDGVSKTPTLPGALLHADARTETPGSAATILSGPLEPEEEKKTGPILALGMVAIVLILAGLAWSLAGDSSGVDQNDPADGAEAEVVDKTGISQSDEIAESLPDTKLEPEAVAAVGNDAGEPDAGTAEAIEPDETANAEKPAPKKDSPSKSKPQKGKDSFKTLDLTY